MGSTLEAQKKRAPKPKREKFTRDTWSDMPENPTLPRIYGGSKGYRGKARPEHLIYRAPKDGKPPVVKGPLKVELVEEPLLELNDGGMARKTRVF